jgi:hypothetical protein
LYYNENNKEESRPTPTAAAAAAAAAGKNKKKETLPSAPHPHPSSKKNKTKRKREGPKKNPHDVPTIGHEKEDRHEKKKKKKQKITKKESYKKLLEGLVLSISTDSLGKNSTTASTKKQTKGGTSAATAAAATSGNKDEEDDDNHHHHLFTYKQACTMAQELGATVSAQVHNKVHAVLCQIQDSSSSSSNNSWTTTKTTHSRNSDDTSSCDATSHVLSVTQRMKKALKKSIPIWDLQWLVKIHKCHEWIDPEPFYNVTQVVRENVRRQEQNVKDDITSDEGPREVHVQDESEEEYLNTVETGWSEPISLDCCCVCHDDDREDCPWCFQGDAKCIVFLKKSKQGERVEV